ncbi:sialate O-acetylesterase [Neotamlana laminarinivorans]|uniref:Sialate O-acetylesterase domain-containing protein n=1 Tax=Neotamlana laminarinivorans TaxID=2883124 RepID=A0A9X1HZV5_9FLAO|nr:sialate O-acetylesterase [Tamlana laminarinivorans]MCB4798826.1 hypothetical protein [Tamlana laminarinivorans]
MNNQVLNTLTLLLLLTKSVLSFSQELKPSNLFGDNMVLQQGVAVPVWGLSSPNDSITVTFSNQNKSTLADSNGKWMLKLEPLQANKTAGEMIIKSKSSEIKIKNILVGEVWICSGQSNMQMNVDNVPDVKAITPLSENIRSFDVKRTVSFEEEDEVTGKWQLGNSSSAVASAFSYYLEQLGDIPVGIIHASWGSSSIEAWMPRDMENDFMYFKNIMYDFDKDMMTRNTIKKSLNAPNGWSQKEDVFMRRQPNIIYNAMMHPLIPFACRGLVWYQGERNTRYISGVPTVNETNWFHRVIGMQEYSDVLQQWILNYRKKWQNDTMHFAIVMLPGYGKGTVKKPDIDPENPTEESFAWMRASQLKALNLPNTSVVNTIDLGDVDNIHPKDKLPIGERLALLVAKNTLNKPIIAEGPMLKSVEVSENKLIIHFKNSNGLKTTDGETPKGFWIADSTKKWKMADAKIEGETVILSHNDVNTPLYVRYAFAGKPNVNLVNEENLPAYPFKTR